MQSEPWSMRRVDVADFEADLHGKLQAELDAKNRETEEGRLGRVRASAEQLRVRIRAQSGRDAASSGGRQLRRLQGRLEGLLVEEQKIKERLDKLPVVVVSDNHSGDVDRGDAPLADPEQTTAVPQTEEPEPSDTEQESLEDAAAEVEMEDDFDHVCYKRRLEAAAISDSSIDELVKPLAEQRRFDFDVIHLPSHQFVVPSAIYNRLFEYQRAGMQWILRLYAQRAGGILGDEMGLGKTMQVVASIAALQCSGLLSAPVLIVCPTTLIRQWLTETMAWWPALRVLVIHAGLVARKRSLLQALRRAFDHCHVVITSYGHLQLYSDDLIDAGCRWKAVFLDEGHKLRNPHAAVTTACKRIRTIHRYILSGTPIQNNLLELWSLVDFCFPGKLGSLAVFKDEFSLPISAGGYVNATSMQVQRAYTSACALRDLIEPYLLRRLKVDVAKQLPPKREQIVFCRLSDYQRSLYLAFLDSDDVHSILLGKRNVLYGIDVLRKICNHPDLLAPAPWNVDIRAPVDALDKSAKMKQVLSILGEWRRDGHKALLFCQTRQMLDIVEACVGQHFQPPVQSLRMDGSTAVAQRALLVDRFNASPHVFVFFLTTRVGGLGVNLTSADRVLIVDPDWNPSTDQQARERSWRLGQERPVCVYRLVCEGTVEEKILHRQVFKTFLTHRVLKDPKQSRFFKHSDLHDLFTLGVPGKTQGRLESPTESGGEEGEEDARLVQDIVELAGLQTPLELSRAQRDVQAVKERSRQIVADSVAVLQTSGKTVRSAMGISDLSIDSTDLLNAVRCIASEADPRIVHLARQVVAFIGSDSVTTASIFARFAPSDHHTALVLRQTLRAVSVLDKTAHTWALKPEYREHFISGPPP